MNDKVKNVFVIGASAAKVNKLVSVTVPSTSVPVELLRKYSSPKPTLKPPSAGGRKST